MMVALIGVLSEFRALPLTDYEVAELAFKIERQELGIRGGLQDQYAAAFGGFNFIELDGERVVVNPLRIRPDIVLELEHNLLLAFTGTTRTADHIIDDQTRRFETADSDAVAGLRRQKELAIAMKDALLRRRLRDFGGLLDDAWHAKKLMSDRITNPQIDEMYERAKFEGALGGKVTGAGGGGFMLFYCEHRCKHRVADALTEMGARVEEFAFDQEGMRVWRALQQSVNRRSNRRTPQVEHRVAIAAARARVVRAPRRRGRGYGPFVARRRQDSVLRERRLSCRRATLGGGARRPLPKGACGAPSDRPHGQQFDRDCDR